MHPRRLRSLTSAASSAVLAALVVAFGLGFGLAQRDPGAGRDRGHDIARPGSSSLFWQRTTLPEAQARPAGLSPFGDRFREPVTAREPRGMVVTALGHLDLKAPRLLDGLPPALRRPAARTRPGRGGVAAGTNIVQVRADALQSLGVDGVERELRRFGRVAGTLPERAFIVRSRQADLGDLLDAGIVEAAVPYEPALKIARTLGRTPMIQRSRAKSDVLDILVAAWPGAPADELQALRDRLEAIAGLDAVVPYDGDAALLRLSLPAAQVAAVAAVDEVQAVQEVPEQLLFNSEGSSLIMTGSFEDTLGARPFHDIGVDGGGIDTNGDGRRVNDGSDAVSPQIVAVTDNGLSLDSVQFSQSATEPSTALFPVGPTHRKVHAQMRTADQSLQSCDGVLDGSSTHGNVVAGVIAGWPSGVGAFASKTILLRNPIITGINMDGVARGARIIIQDVGDVSRCTFNELVEKGGNVTAGNLATRMREARDGGDNVHLQIFPFGTPNFNHAVENPENGDYTIESGQLDTFMVNNRDFLVVAPVGNKGSSSANLYQQRYPDLFDGTAVNNDPNVPVGLQISPPATAKNVVAVGGHRYDMQSYAGSFNQEEVMSPWVSHGPATALSLRTAPLLMAPAEDYVGYFGAPGITGVAVFRSRDDDDFAPVEAQLDENNVGTSFAAAHATGAAALVRDYFAQGFYPTGSRVTDDRMPRLSGALVKAALVASANFLEQGSDTGFPTTNDRLLGQSRALFSSGTGSLGNNEQGYGRIQLANVLPLPNWPPARPVGAPDTLEYPAAGLLIYDDRGTGEAPISNTLTSVERTFRVNAPNTILVAGGGRAVAAGALRVALAWPDPPGDTLVNDLDLELESPGPDNCLFSGDTGPGGAACGASAAADNVVYDGNAYIGGQTARGGQWSAGRATGGIDAFDTRNPVEAVHVSSNPDGIATTADSSLYTGTWRVRVKRGRGGAVPGAISAISGTNEDDNDNGRLDTGEDDDLDGLLDAGGQPYGLVVSGPVFGIGTQSWSGRTHALPPGQVNLDKATYGCSDDVVVRVFDPAATSAASVESAVTLTVQTPAGVVLDTERGFAFSETPAGSRGFSSAKVPVRVAAPNPVANNGLLETDTGQFIVVQYVAAAFLGQARATVRCNPDLFAGYLSVNDQADSGALFHGGCDRDQYPDAGENLAYTVAVMNGNRGDDYSEVTATLTPSGTGATAVRVLDSPKPIGRLPGGQVTGIGFSLRIDAAALNALPIASRKVTLTLQLDSTTRAKILGRQTFSFTHPLNADKDVLHYSTDFPSGGREVRDLNRNLQVDKADIIDPFTGIQIPDEDITFSTLYLADAGVVRNTVGEDLNGNGNLDGNEDIIPNSQLDRGILASASGPVPADDKVPFSFDRNNGGMRPFRSVLSVEGASVGVLWEHKTSGLCGFQTAIPDGDTAVLFQNNGAGIWHTGDGDPDTPAAAATACDNYHMPANGQTPIQAERILDILQSPIIARVHQTPDARGFPYSVEFQRLAVNLNIQTLNNYAGGFINFDSDIDTDDRNCLMCQKIFYPRSGGVYYNVARFITYTYGIDPENYDVTPQRTFGPLTDTNGSVANSRTVTGDETGFSGFTANSNPNSSSPIPTAPPDFLPYPVPGGPLPTTPPPELRPADNTIAGPTRNFDLAMIEYNDGLAFFETGPGPFEPNMFFSPGQAGNRWQIGVGFFSIENGAATTDYGVAIDDLVLEWDETHPVDESQFVPAHTPACQRFGQAGQAAGQSCASLVVDRTTLYECDDAIQVTVNDPKRSGQSSVTVQAASDTDGTQISTGAGSASVPVKTFTLPAIAPGVFQGTITVTGQGNTPGSLFVTPSTDQIVSVYYVDPLCDGDADGQVGEQAFDNIDGDGIASTVDRCPQTYDPAQVDTDADGRGNLCDNCPGVQNGPLAPRDAQNRPLDDQTDSNGDGVGDACDFDDIDFDGVENSLDNCPDVYNPTQVKASPNNPRGDACNQTSTRDGDAIQDKSDNCVRTANATQADSDGDGIGDACDGDCAGAIRTTFTGASAGSCSRSSHIVCGSDANCPATGTCSISMTICTATNQCAGTGNTCIGISPEVCVRAGVVNSGSCSAVNDDMDIDTVRDEVDSCPAISNPPIIAGTLRQRDLDLDGLGDECDPVGNWDDDNSGVPDDVLSYNVAVGCRVLPLARLIVRQVSAGDLDGDRDVFPDSGEKARVYLTVQNGGTTDLTNVNLNLNSSDPDVACITKPSIFLPLFPAGETVVLGTYGPNRVAGDGDDTGSYYELVASQSLRTLTGTDPATLDLILTLTSAEILGTAEKVNIRVLADLDLPVTPQTRIPGPDGLSGTADDGTWLETFDVERDGTAGISIADQPLGTTGVLNDTMGFTVRSGQAGIGTLAGVACGGFHIPPADPACLIDTDHDMGWHIHCPSSGAGVCPNTGTAITPVTGELAHSGTNSLHWGHHLNNANRIADTTRFRQLAAFTTNPINLALFPETGDLQLSFFHIASMVSNYEANISKNLAFDYGDVHIQVDQNEDPAPTAVAWGFWDKLVPFENVYDHIPQAWSTFGTSLTYCQFTPGDAGSASPAPRGVHETMCWPLGVWSNCGWQWDRTTTFDCPGPGQPGTTGNGNWVQTKFDLARYLGQTVRIRWIGQSWVFNATAQSYQELGGTWANLRDDDGWWVDDITVTGAITAQLTPPPDTKAPKPGVCPATCNPAAAGSDRGTSPVLTVTDTNGDGVIERGERIVLDASASTLPGNCVGGVAQFRFTRDGAVVQDWTTNNNFIDSPLIDADYRLFVRCSADVANCTGTTGAGASAKVYTGDGADIALAVVPGTGGRSALSWVARPQPTSVSGYDVFRGVLAITAPGAGSTFSTLACLASDIAQPAVGATVNLEDAVAPTSPAVGNIYYYLVGHSARAAGGLDALGRKSDQTIRVSPLPCP